MSTSAVRRVVDVAGGPIDAVARRRLTHPSVVALIYHRVGGRSQSPVDLDRRVFADQLDSLAATGRVIDLDTAVEFLNGSNESHDATEPFVVLTFDDGTADWVDEVLPELVDRSLPATFYVSTDFVEASRPFPDDGMPISWSGLAELSSSGLATIGSHTHTHRVLADVTSSIATDEIDRSVGLIEERLGVDCTHFAYPKAIAPSSAAEHVVRRRFASAALAGNRANVGGCTDLYRLGRHGLTVNDDPVRFACKVDGGARLEGWLREHRDSTFAGAK